MRLKVRCARAIRFPTTMVATASHHTSACQAGTASNASPRTRSSAANAAAFTAVTMYPVTGVGAPSYTSGAHIWKGCGVEVAAGPVHMWAPEGYGGGAGPVTGLTVTAVKAAACAARRRVRGGGCEGVPARHE